MHEYAEPKIPRRIALHIMKNDFDAAIGDISVAMPSGA
jgi:hypothetical protein